jgi:hypothetical protein
MDSHAEHMHQQQNQHHQQQSHTGGDKQVNLPTPEMSPLENSDKEGQMSEENRCAKGPNPVQLLINKFSNPPFPSRTPPFAQFQTMNPGAHLIHNHSSNQNNQNNNNQQQHVQSNSHNAHHHHHHHQHQLLASQLQQHNNEYSHYHHGRQLDFYESLSAPLYQNSGQYAIVDHYTWLAQQESEEGSARTPSYHLEHPQGLNNNNNNNNFPGHYDYCSSPTPNGYPTMDANHNSFYSYGVTKIEPQDSLMSSPYDHHNSPGSTASNGGSSSATGSTTGGGATNAPPEYENNSSSSLIFKALSEACNGAI